MAEVGTVNSRKAITWTLLIAGAVVLFFVRSAVFAPFLVLGIVLPSRARDVFARSWAWFIVGLAAFEIGRGAIYARIEASQLLVYGAYAIRADQALLLGHTAPELFQRWRSPGLDRVALVLHFSHFLFFYSFAGAVWWWNERAGRWVLRAILFVFVAGLAFYFAVPTEPPWLASEHGHVPSIQHTALVLYSKLFGASRVALLDTNPVAAMPSLHAAVPVACALIASREFPAWAPFLWLYAFAQCVAVMYLGEHYLVDVLAGTGLALVSVRVTAPRSAVG